MNKEALITEKKKRELGNLPVFHPEYLLMQDQEILNADFLINDLEGQVKSSVENGCFIILNEPAVNAYAYRMNGVNVVALSAGSLYRCIYAADLFMLSENFMPDVGDLNACYGDVAADAFPPEESEDGNIGFKTSADDERRNLGYMIAALAFKYMVYHEIGHHVCGHVDRLQDSLGLDSGETGLSKVLSPDDYKMMETEADIFAVQKLADEFGDLMAKWNPFLEGELQELELFQLLETALVIVKENLSRDPLSIDEIEKGRYYPKMIRLIVDVTAVIVKLQKSLLAQFRFVLDNVPETRELVESQMGPISLDDQTELERGLLQYLILVVVSSEQIYGDIFWGSHDPIVFRSDMKAGEWWKRMR